MDKKGILTKKRLIKETALHIKKNGIDNLSMRQIAGECNMSHTAIYRYFHSKADLINAVYPFIEKKAIDFLNKTLLANTSQDPFSLFCKSYIRYMIKNPHDHYFLHFSPETRQIYPNETLFWKNLLMISPLFIGFSTITEENQAILLRLVFSILNGFIFLYNRKIVSCEDPIDDFVDSVLCKYVKPFLQEEAAPSFTK